MNKLIKFSVNHPVSILMYILLILLFGILSICTIKMDYLPYISDRHILVSTEYEGLPAAQMKELVTIPEEDFFSSLKGIKNISSVTRDSLSFIKIELHHKTDINNSLLETRQIIDQLYPSLPEKASKPKAEIFSTDKNYLLTIAVIPPENKLSKARYTIEKHIKHELQKINGCGKIEILGGVKNQITVETDIDLLNSRNITINQIADSILSTNYEYPAGSIKDDQNEYILKTSHLFSSPKEILETQIESSDKIFKLEELAEIKNDFVEKESFCTYNSHECIEIEVSKKTEESPVTLSAKISNYLVELKDKYPDYQFIITNDISKEIKNNIILVYLSALIGTIVTFFILFLFYKNIKISMIVSSVIPLCILFSILVLKLLNKNINLFSLSGISISLGMIVDPAIIMIQKTVHNNKKYKNLKFEDIIIKSGNDIQKSNLSSSITTIIVFIPFFLLPGIFGELFTDLSIAIISNIFFSYFLSITYIPALSKITLNKSISSLSEPQKLIAIKHKYKNIISININSLKTVIKILSLSILFTLIICFAIKKEIIPSIDSKIFNFTVKFPSNNSISYIQTQTEQLNNKILINFPNATISSKGGIDSNNYHKLSDYKNTKTTVLFSIQNLNKKEIKKLQTFLSDISLNYTIEKTQDIISRALNLNSKILIQDYNSSTELANIPFAIPDFTTNEVSFIPDTLKCNYYKIPKNYISFFCYEIINGLNAGEILLNGTYIPIKIKSKNIDQNNINIQYNNSTIPLKALGDFSINETEKILYRYNKKDSKEIIKLTAEIPSEKVLKLKNEQLDEMKVNAYILIFIVFILLYCFLGAQLESLILPFLLLLTVIPAAAGAIFSLFIFRQSININSILSLVVLFGTCVNNAIIFHESIQAQFNFDSIPAICSTEFTSIFITTITSIAALIPFTIDPLHINSQISISIALCGGLLSSMIISILIYPIIFNKLRNIIYEKN